MGRWWATDGEGRWSAFRHVVASGRRSNVEVGNDFGEAARRQAGRPTRLAEPGSSFVVTLCVFTQQSLQKWDTSRWQRLRELIQRVAFTDYKIPIQANVAEEFIHCNFLR